MFEMMPLWWDGLTITRIVGLVVLVFAWFATGLMLAPWFLRKFDDATVGYVDWMVEMFDRMFIVANRRWCMLSIVLSTVLFGFLGYWLTTGIPWSPWGYHVIRFIVISILVVGTVVAHLAPSRRGRLSSARPAWRGWASSRPSSSTRKAAPTTR